MISLKNHTATLVLENFATKHSSAMESEDINIPSNDLYYRNVSQNINGTDYESTSKENPAGNNRPRHVKDGTFMSLKPQATMACVGNVSKEPGKKLCNGNVKNGCGSEVGSDDSVCPDSEEEEEVYIEDNGDIRVANKTKLSTPAILNMMQAMDQGLRKNTKETVEKDLSVAEEEYSAEIGCEESDVSMRLCRLCARSRGNMVYIFSNSGFQLGLCNKISTWLPTRTVSKTDPLPKQVCEFCIKKLEFCSRFGKSCLKAEQVLNDLFDSEEKIRYNFHSSEEENSSIYSVDSQKMTEKMNLNCNLFNGALKKRKENGKSSSKMASSLPIEVSVNHSEANLVKKEPGSSDDDIVSASSESELVDMMEDSSDYEFEVADKTNYCCPLCCEGNMVTIKRIKTNSVPELNMMNGFEKDLKFNNVRNNKSLPIGKIKYKDMLHSKVNDASSNEGEMLERNCDINMGNNSESGMFVKSIRQFEEEGSNHGPVLFIDKSSNNGDAVSSVVKSEDSASVKCTVCGESVINLNDCLIHALRIHGNIETHSFPCSQCEKCFTVDTDLNRHFMLKHLNMKAARLIHICITCGRRCASQRALASHVCIPLNSLLDQLACKICGQSFSTKARLVFHREFHGPAARSLECVPCGLMFTEEEVLYDHVRFSHRGQSLMCSECGQHFNSKAALRAHVRSHRNLRLHKCEICSKTFLDKQTLKEHAVSHMEIKPYQCHICGKYLNRNSRLKKHLLSHELQNVTDPQECFCCTVCDEIFPNEPKAVEHAHFGHTAHSEVECVFQLLLLEKIYRCEFCERCYAEPASLNTHRSSHDGEAHPFKCHICGAGFAAFARLATHKVTHGIYEKKDDFSIPKLFLCNECDKAYVHWTYLSVHRKMVHAEVKHMYKCKMCPEQFVNSWSLAYHRKTRHAESASLLSSNLPMSERKRWRCKYCEKRYVTQQALLDHISILHSGDNPGPNFQCDECGKRFARKLSLDSHKKIHNGLRSHICPICEKSFVHSSGLSSHLRLHRGDKPHACEYCGKTFLQRGDRDDHVRKHTGEKPFSCQQCSRSFRTRAMWFEHSRIHSDERPFPCDVCGAAFRRSYALKNHKTIHTGERPHTCDICTKSFRQKQDLQKHVRNHHQEIQEQKQNVEDLTLLTPSN